MAIDPLGSGNISESGHKRVSGVSNPDTASRVAATRTPGTDSVEVSDEARKLAEPDIPEGTLTADTLRKVSTRISDGSYNVDSVIDTIADGLRDQVG